MDSSIKKQLLRYVLFLVVFIGLYYCAEIIHLFDSEEDKLFQMIKYGYINDFLINLCKWVWYICMLVGAYFYSKKYLIIKGNENKPKEIPLKRVGIIYGIVVLFSFIVTSSLGFKLKIVYDLGENITSFGIVNRLSDIATGIFRMPIVLYVIRYVDEIIRLFTKKEYVQYIPVAGVFSMIVFGIYDLVIIGVNPLSLVFFFMYIVYNYIYVFTYRNFLASSIVNSIIFVL